ncbi:gamma-glutamyl-gamma-aminobutyrate hydrolase family protein [Microvirga sp. 2MCAF35]|uniref:gamma-glutamyl-gamma-aminobutyrate hydrolase family protein n=1 Tax=Microvirga sp. 2MCAF35 TaxID=3232987 RepID=UPI003F973A26
MSGKPRIAVIMDENTSVDGTRYDMTKAYFVAIQRAGGLPFGIPYVPEMIEPVIDEFDGFLSVGGRFAFPDSWYVDGQVSNSPPSERLEIETTLMRGFLERNKPILGICNGMQVLAALHGCRLSPNVRSLGPHVMEHDKRGFLHPVTLRQDTRLSRIIGLSEILVNSFHREAVVDMSDQAIASAHAADGIVEAIEIPAQRFAIGVQWHQELFTFQDHPGNRLFEAFVQATRKS